MSRISLRVYFVEDESGLLTGKLIARSSTRNEYLATGTTEEEVLARLGAQFDADSATEQLESFIWSEPLHVDRVVVEVRPQSSVGKRMVIGKQRIPIELHFVWAALQGEQRDGTPAGFRVMLPRFGFAIVIEELRMAAEVLRQVVSAALTGESARSLFEFREVKREYVVDWSPRLRRARRTPAVQRESFDVLRSVAEDWCELAAAGKLGAHQGPANEAEYLELIHARVKPSVLLVGPSGVGKTEWVKELARRAHRARTTELDVRVWATSADQILAGQVYLGMWEQRCLDMIAELSGEGHYLFLDRLGDFVRPRSGASAISDLFLTALTENTLSVIAECTPEEFQRLQSRHASLLSRFRVIRLEPPEREEACQRAAEYAARALPGWRIPSESVRRLVRHLQSFKKSQAFPGSAFGFLGWLVQHESSSAQTPGAKSLEPPEIDGLFSRYTGLGAQLISEGERAPASRIALALQQRVAGQNRACDGAAQVLARFKAGINDPEKPIGSLLFVGPTGVGKTELAKELARYLFGSEERLVRLDMSEFMLANSSARLLADERGAASLVQRVGEQPLSLILLDEIEKAHSAVFDLLLGLLGEGRLTSASGRLVDFRMTLVVMTSNLGTDVSTLGFGDSSASAQPYVGAVRAHFRPEFLNRIDQIVPFSALTPEALRKIVEFLLAELVEREGLKRRNLRLQVSDRAKDQLALLGTNRRYGARPLKRVIEQQVVTPLAIELARRPSLQDARVHVTCSDAGIEVQIQAP
ncbi:MAG TPA: AAA family ATPase [Polyangiaceae bacterium]|nr:AAA family ATPase [Polyangiaceae bacterium]